MSETESVTEVARRLFRAIDEERWTEAAACLDPGLTTHVYDSALQRMRRDREAELDPVATSATESTAGDRERRQAVVRIAVRRVLRNPPDETVESLEELEAMSALEFMARTLAKGSRTATRLVRFHQRPARRRLMPGGPELPDVRILRLVIGAAHETDDVAHIIYRRLLRRNDWTHLLEPIGVATFHRVSGVWYARGPAQAGWTGVLMVASDQHWHQTGRQATLWF